MVWKGRGFWRRLVFVNWLLVFRYSMDIDEVVQLKIGGDESGQLDIYRVLSDDICP